MKQSELPRRREFIRRRQRLKRANLARAKRRKRDYQAFIQSPFWRQQKQRVHERDGWQCTVVEQEAGLQVRCGYTRDDGSLHAHHLRYHPRGLKYTPDKDITTRCPRHHDRDEKAKWWKHPRPY